jgi:hypothetical protein
MISRHTTRNANVKSTSLPKLHSTITIIVPQKTALKTSKTTQSEAAHENAMLSPTTLLSRRLFS